MNWPQLCRLVRATGLALAGIVLLVGCDLPRDPEGTLDRVRGGTLRVGVTAREPWTNWERTGRDRRPTGIEVELVERFARELDAEILWVRGSESELFTSLEQFDVDLVVGGLTDDTPWSDRIALSRTFAETADGKHVMATPPGENALLLRLDRFLAREQESIDRRIADEGAVLREAETP